MTTFEPQHTDFAAIVAASFEKQGLMQALGIELIKVEPGLCELRAGWREDLGQQHGYFHGALVGAMLDSAGGYAALSLMPAESEVLTAEYKVNFVAAAQSEELIARGRVIRPGRTLTVTEAQAYCLSGRGRDAVRGDAAVPDPSAARALRRRPPFRSERDE